MPRADPATLALATAQKLPFGIIKIDRSFVQGGPKGGRHALLTRAIIEMGHALGLSVEGIETSNQASRFIAMCADHLQGFYHAPPGRRKLRPATDSPHSAGPTPRL